MAATAVVLTLMAMAETPQQALWPVWYYYLGRVFSKRKAGGILWSSEIRKMVFWVEDVQSEPAQLVSACSALMTPA